MPVTLTPIRLCPPSRAPIAIACATSGLTAPTCTDQFRRHSQKLCLGLVGIRHQPQPEDARGIRHIREALGDQAAGAGLGDGDALAQQLQQADDDAFQGFVVHAVDDIAQPLANAASRGAISAKASSGDGARAVIRRCTSPVLA